ncbi:MAG: 50S ribosomal protein L18 [Candidatus Cloacimonadota bacterium]|nr:MAG: 50S ribosomal protein L18 [Candidatus Cloacimonadota bacterium]
MAKVCKSKRRELIRKRRKRSIRKKIFGTPDKPRLSIYRSSQHIYAQIIDDVNGHSLVAMSTIMPLFKKQATDKMTKMERSKLVGKLLAEQSKAKNISKVCFDRNGFLYHGRVKALADSARENGLQF